MGKKHKYGNLAEAASNVVTLIRYKNRKIYNTVNSVYVNSSDLLNWPVKFRILKHGTDEDVTERVMITARARSELKKCA